MRRPLLLIALLSGAIEAHVGDVVFPVYEIPSSAIPDVHDDTLEDFEEALPAASITTSDLVGINDGPAPEVESLAWRVFLAWNDQSQKVYVGVEILDDVYLSESSTEGSTIYVDGDHSGGAYFNLPSLSVEESTTQRFSNAQQYHFGLASDPSFVIVNDGQPSWASVPPFVDTGGWATGGRPARVQIKLSMALWDRLDHSDEGNSKRSVLRSNQVIGFQIMIADTDHNETLDGVYALGWIRGLEPHTSASSFVDAQLVPCYFEDCSESGSATVVRPGSWAMIKASVSNVADPKVQ